VIFKDAREANHRQFLAIESRPCLQLIGKREIELRPMIAEASTRTPTPKRYPLSSMIFSL
jgi:hypothetical protein